MKQQICGVMFCAERMFEVLVYLQEKESVHLTTRTKKQSLRWRSPSLPMALCVKSGGGRP